MNKPRVVVTPSELEAALGVWLRVLPQHVWRRYVEFEKKRLDKRDTEADLVDPRDAIAKHLAGKFEQAAWEATHEKKGNLFG